jgi:very-short-patch-repair endonuclease
MHDEERLLALAARQHGLAHQKQLAESGFSRSARDHLVATGRWRRRGGHVLQAAGSPESIEQAAMLAVLDLDPVGAAISHQSAAARWGLPGFSLRPFHVTGDRVRGRNDTHYGVVHQPRLLLPDHILVLDGIPTTTPTRTVFDLAAVLRWPLQVERAMDNAIAAELTTIRQLRVMLRQLARKGRPGIRLMRALLDARGLDYVPCATNLESRFQYVAGRAGFRGFVRQVDVGDEYDWIGRVDFVDRERRVIVEVQSSRFHKALLDAARDAERIAKLRAAGWTVVEVSEHDVWHNPDNVIAALRRACA